MNNILKKIIVVCIVSIMFVHVGPVFSADENQENNNNAPTNLKEQYQQQLSAFGGDQGAKLGDPQDPRVIVAGIIKIFLSIVALLVVVYIIYGGYLYLTSAGAEDRIEQGKKIIINSVIGLLIVMIAHSVVYTIYRTVYEGAINPYGTYFSPAPGTYINFETVPENNQFYNDPTGGDLVPKSLIQ